MQAIGQPVYVVRGVQRVDGADAGIHQFVDSVWTAPTPAHERSETLGDDRGTAATPQVFALRAAAGVPDAVYVVRTTPRVGGGRYVDSVYGTPRAAADRRDAIEADGASAIVERYPVDALADGE